MTKGTTSQGPRHTKVHTTFRRCGACAYPATKTRRFDGWGCKVRGRKGEGTGRMNYLKTITRKAKNGFREVNNFVKASTAKKQLGTRSKTLVRSKVPRRKLI